MSWSEEYDWLQGEFERFKTRFYEAVRKQGKSSYAHTRDTAVRELTERTASRLARLPCKTYVGPDGYVYCNHPVLKVPVAVVYLNRINFLKACGVRLKFIPRRLS